MFFLLLAQTAPNFATMLNNLVTGIRPVAVPLAGVSLVIVFLLQIGSPLVPDAAQQNKGAIMKVLLSLVFIAIIPELVTWVGTLGGSATP